MSRKVKFTSESFAMMFQITVSALCLVVYILDLLNKLNPSIFFYVSCAIANVVSLIYIEYYEKHNSN